MESSVILYGDLFLLFQLLWNGCLIILSACLSRYHLTKGKFFAFLFVFSADFLFVGRPLWIRIAVLILQGILAWKIGKSRSFCIALFLVSAIAGGFWMMLPQYGWQAALGGCLAIALYIKYIPKTDIYTVCCCHRGRKIRIKALYDTGNRLFLPDGSEMVSLIAYDAIKPIFSWEQIENPQIVSFSSLGNENGLLFAVPIDSFIIVEKNLEKKYPYIGITQQSLSVDGSYQMILHRDIFMGGN